MTEKFEPTTLVSLANLAENMTKSAGHAFEAVIWSHAWMELAAALDGEGLNLELLNDLSEYLDVNYISEASLELAEKEADILQARQKAGECLDCGRKHADDTTTTTIAN